MLPEKGDLLSFDILASASLPVFFSQRFLRDYVSHLQSCRL